MSKYLIPLALFVNALLISDVSFASGWRDRNFSFDTYYTSYQNVSIHNNVSLNLPPSLDFDFGYRTYKIFSFHAHASHFFAPQSADQIQSKITQYGLGFKVDLPGFFFIGADSEDMLNNQKQYPVCTSAFFDLIKTTTTMNGVLENGFSHRAGLTMDFFLFNESVYLTLRGGAFTFLGDTYSFYSAGLGAIF